MLYLIISHVNSGLFYEMLIVRSEFEAKLLSLCRHETASLTNDNLLLSGTVLQNTKEVVGVCVYSGKETKMSLNSKITSVKFSTIERSLNRYVPQS